MTTLPIGGKEALAGNKEFHDPPAPIPATVHESSSPSINARVTFYRSTLFHILVVGMCAFTDPGIWSAMNGLGVGGSQSPDLVNAANAILYAFMTFTCFAGPWLTNAIGFRQTLALGTLRYPHYAAGLEVNNRTGAIWFLYFGAVTCDISAGFFRSVEGAIACGFPEQHKRGQYIATWFTFRNFGNVIGGAISLGINININRHGKVAYQTYLAFIAIQCLGSFFALLISNSDRVVRDEAPVFRPLEAFTGEKNSFEASRSYS